MQVLGLVIYEEVFNQLVAREGYLIGLWANGADNRRSWEFELIEILEIFGGDGFPSVCGCDFTKNETALLLVLPDTLVKF